MADNIAVTPSSQPDAKDVATDDVGGIHYQVVKLAVGADGAAALVGNDDPLPASIQNAFVRGKFDHVDLAYDGGGRLTVVTYRFGGPAGSVVATLSLAYSNGRLASVTKT